MKKYMKGLAAMVGTSAILTICIFVIIQSNRTQASEIRWVSAGSVGEINRSQKAAYPYTTSGPTKELSQVFMDYVTQCIQNRVEVTNIADRYIEKYTEYELAGLCTYVMIDHPEMFQISEIGIDVYNGKLYFQYKYPSNIGKGMQSDLEIIIQDFMEKVPSGWSEMEKALYVYTYITSNIAPVSEHEMQFDNKEEARKKIGENVDSIEMDAYTALAGRKGSKAAMCYAFKVLADQLGLENYVTIEEVDYIEGNKNYGLDHRNYKNIVKINGKWYYMDPFRGSGDGRGCISYDYFMMSYTKAWGRDLDNRYGTGMTDVMWKANDAWYDNYDWCQEDEENAVNQGLMYNTGYWYANDGTGHILKYSCDGKELTLEGVVGNCGEYVSGYMDNGTIYYTGGDDTIRAFELSDASDRQVFQCPESTMPEEEEYFNNIMKKAMLTSTVVMGPIEKRYVTDGIQREPQLKYDKSTVCIYYGQQGMWFEGDECYDLDMDSMTLVNNGIFKGAWIKAYALHQGTLILYLGNTSVGDMLLEMQIADDCLKASGRYGKDYFYVNDRNIHSIYKNIFGEGVYRTDEDHTFLTDACQHEYEISTQGDDKNGYYKRKYCNKCGKEWNYDFIKVPQNTSDSADATAEPTGTPWTWAGNVVTRRVRYMDVYTLKPKPAAVTSYPKPTKTPKLTETPAPSETTAITSTPAASASSVPTSTPKVTATQVPTHTPQALTSSTPTRKPQTSLTPLPVQTLPVAKTSVPPSQMVTDTPVYTESPDTPATSGYTALKVSARQTGVKRVRITWNKNASGTLVEIVRGKKGSNEGIRIAAVSMKTGKYLDKNNRQTNCWYRCYALDAEITRSISPKVNMSLYTYKAPKIKIVRKVFRGGGYLKISLQKEQNCYIECYRRSRGQYRKLALQNSKFCKGHRELNIAYDKRMKSVICKFRIYRKRGGQIRYSAYTKPVTIRLK